jgi:hypothetical protein
MVISNGSFYSPVVIDDLSRDAASRRLVASTLSHLYCVVGSLPQAAGYIFCGKMSVYQAPGSSETSNFQMLQLKEDHTFTGWNWIQTQSSLQIEFQHRFDICTKS